MPIDISAKPQVTKDELLVDGFSIFCKFYKIETIKQIFLNYKYQPISITTFPSVLPIIPQIVLENSDDFNYLKTADKLLEEMGKGYYISAIFKK